MHACVTKWWEAIYIIKLHVIYHLHLSGQLDVANYRVNFVVPDVKVLNKVIQHSTENASERRPGSITNNIELVAYEGNISYKICLDDKKISSGFC